WLGAIRNSQWFDLGRAIGFCRDWIVGPRFHRARDVRFSTARLKVSPNCWEQLRYRRLAVGMKGGWSDYRYREKSRKLQFLKIVAKTENPIPIVLSTIILCYS